MALEDAVIIAALAFGAAVLIAFIAAQLRGDVGSLWAGSGAWATGVTMVLAGAAAGVCRLSGVL